IAPAVRRLRTHGGSIQVRRLAAALVEKWRAETVDQVRREKRRNPLGLKQQQQ
ncbi:hypothetical protein MNEG_4184, partial [Monoraphidium neglectum]